MLKAKNKEAGEIITVYAVNGATLLIYNTAYNGGAWHWESNGKYIPE